MPSSSSPRNSRRKHRKNKRQSSAGNLGTLDRSDIPPPPVKVDISRGHSASPVLAVKHKRYSVKNSRDRSHSSSTDLDRTSGTDLDRTSGTLDSSRGHSSVGSNSPTSSRSPRKHYRSSKDRDRSGSSKRSEYSFDPSSPSSTPRKHYRRSSERSHSSKTGTQLPESSRRNRSRRSSHGSFDRSYSSQPEQLSGSFSQPESFSNLPIFDDNQDIQRSPKQQRRRSSKSNHASHKSRRKREKADKARSHSPTYGRTISKTTKSSKANSNKHQRERPKSESSLDVSKHMEEEGPVHFNDDANSGSAAGKKKRRAQRSSKQPTDMETELVQMLGEMNGGGSMELKGASDGITLDTTTNSKASTKSKSKKKKRAAKPSADLKKNKVSPETPSKKAVKIKKIRAEGELSSPALSGHVKTPPKRSKSHKSSLSKASKKSNNRKNQRKPKSMSNLSAGGDTASSKKKKKRSSKGYSDLVISQHEQLEAEDAISSPPLSSEHSKKSKKKKRSNTKSPTRNKLPAVSGHSKSLPQVSNHANKRDASGKIALRSKHKEGEVENGDPPGDFAFNDNAFDDDDFADDLEVPLVGTSRHDHMDVTDHADNRSPVQKPKKTLLKRSQSYEPNVMPSPGTLRRTASEKDSTAVRSANSTGQNRLRRAKSLFGQVLNPNPAKGAEVGDGDSDNEYEMKQTTTGAKKPGLLGWAKKKMQPTHSPKGAQKYSPGHIRKRLAKGKMFRAALGNKGASSDDHEGLLVNADNRGGQMSLLNLQAYSPPDEKDFAGEDNTIEESHEFKMPINDISNVKDVGEDLRAERQQRQYEQQRMLENENELDVDLANSDGDMPPFSQIISSANITTDDDELSDIRDPEDNIVQIAPPPIMEEDILEEPGEIIMNPDRNDVIYDDKGHPGTIRMLHTLREILVEHQDDIEYSPEVYKIIKRRLKGRKFLLCTNHNGTLAYREATKHENVRLLADFFHEEMRQLFGGSITIHDKGFGDADIAQSVPSSPDKNRRAGAPDNRRNSGNHSNGFSYDGSIAEKYLQRAIAECKWAQELAKPAGDIEMMNIGIDAEEKLISLIEVAESGTVRTQPLKEELDKLGELAKQMMYVSIAPLYERLEEIEENMADYFDQVDAEGGGDYDDDEFRREATQIDQSDRTDGHSGRDRSMEKEGEMYEVAMKNPTYEDEEMNFFEDEEHVDEHDEEGDFDHEGEEDDHHEAGEEYDEEESDEESGTKVKEGEILKCEISDQGDVSSVGESGIYDESESDDDDSDLECRPNEDWNDFSDGDSDEDDDDESETYKSASSDDDESDVSDQPKRKKTIFDEPNPKLKQFFDRLNHFFETRERIQKCIKTTDKDNRCRKIKAKAHTGGLVKKSGIYKKECQQRDTNNKVIRNLNDLYGAARDAQADFKSIVQQLVDEISGLDYKKNIIIPPLKSRDRAYLKAKTEYGSREPGPPESWLYDIVRAGIVCNTVKQLGEAAKWITSNTHVVQAKNRFMDPVFNGYRDLLYHVSIPYGDGISHICEIQVHLKPIYNMNVQCGTIKHYDYFRSSFSNPWRSQEDTLSDLQKMNKYTKIEGPFMKKLLKSEDPEQLLLFGGIFRKQLEEYDRSLELYRRVLGLQEDAGGEDNEAMADTYLSIGLVLGAMGDTDESLQNLLKALAIQESVLGDDHVEVADSYVEIGHMLAKRGDYSGAYTQYQRTQLIRENKLGKEHFLVIKSLQDIGLVLQKKGDFQESEEVYHKALAIQKDVLGESIDLAKTLSMIGKTLCLYGDFEKAMEENKLALSMREKILGKNHKSTAESHTAIGVLQFHKGDYKLSRWHHNRALKIRESMLGKDDQECAISHRHLGELLCCYEGDYEGAVKQLKRAQEILEANVGRDHPVTADSYLDLGHIHCRHGKTEEALAEYRRAKVILESNLGQTHPETAVTYLCTGNALTLSGDHDGALQMHRKALVVFESVLGSSHPRTADGYQSTGDAVAASGNPGRALSDYKKALEIRKEILRKEHPSVAQSCSSIANLLLTACDGNGDPDQRDPRRALEIYREALANTEARCGKDHPASAMARFDVSSALTALANHEDSDDAKQPLLDEAEEQLRETMAVLREVEPFDKETKPTKEYFLGFGEDAAITGRACVALGTVLKQNGKTEEAREMFVEAHERLIRTLGGDHPETLEAESNLLSFVAEP